jgi:tRNA (guanine37-N1)-methyltransferase
MWQATVFTLCPELFPGPLDASILGRARGEGRWSLETVNIRDFSDNPYRSVDDTPAGGGAGLVMRADILAAAIDSVPRNDRPLVYLSPRGRRFDQAMARRLAAGAGALVLCGRFEGIDERLIEARGALEISLGDFVLAGGEVAAMALLEACVRLIPGVLGSPLSLGEESFAQKEGGSRGVGAGNIGAGNVLLEYPQYTRPRIFEGREIPPVLLSGDHKKIAQWRREKAEEITRARRPDLIASGPIRRDNKDKD